MNSERFNILLYFNKSEKLDFQKPHPERRWLGPWHLGQRCISRDRHLGREPEEEFLKNSPEEP